jgi:hypothetical protein
VVESFWARMQTELLNSRRWKTRVELSSAIFDWIEVLSRYAGDLPAGRSGRSGWSHHRDRRPLCRSSRAWSAPRELLAVR